MVDDVVCFFLGVSVDVIADVSDDSIENFPISRQAIKSLWCSGDDPEDGNEVIDDNTDVVITFDVEFPLHFPSKENWFSALGFKIEFSRLVSSC